MRVDQVMSRDPHTLAGSDTLLAAMTLMDRQDIRHIPITREGELVGIVSDRDVKRDRPSMVDEADRTRWRKVVGETPLSMVMTRDPVATQVDTGVRVAVQLFIDSRIGSLPVLEGKKLVGIVTYHDLLRTLLTLLP